MQGYLTSLSYHSYLFLHTFWRGILTIFFNILEHNRTPSGKKMVTGVQLETAS